MFTVRKLVLLALLAASALALQIALAFIPNVELVTLWFLVIGLTLSFKESLIIVLVFTLLEALVWGFGDWVLGYLWIWTIWMILVRLFKPILKDKTHLWALLGASFGFAFGFLFAIQHALLYGFNMGVVYWIRGISFDIIHAFSNYSLILILFTPITKVFNNLIRKWE
jgi:energy-coupling factor transport system substrate-specific component